jgi:uncharacterized membrane protein
MEYIVFKEPYTSYNIPQGGYFVSYKNKLSDNFSDNWYDASRYKNLGPALTRLGIYGLECTSIDSFIKINIDSIRSEQIKRDIKLKKILGDSITIRDVLNLKGRIEVVKDNQLLDYNSDEIVDFIINKIDSNNRKMQNKYKQVDFNQTYLDKEEDLDFWENWANN